MKKEDEAYKTRVENGLIVVIYLSKFLGWICPNGRISHVFFWFMSSSPRNTETASCKKCKERLCTKDPSGRTLHRALCKRGLLAPGCPF
jgi:hypothetical protein